MGQCPRCEGVVADGVRRVRGWLKSWLNSTFRVNRDYGRSCWCLAGIVTALAVVSTADFASYPKARDPYVNDFARVLSADEAGEIRSILGDLRRSAGVEATVVTIESVSDYRTRDGSIESFATGLFNTWGIGDRHRNDGVLILVALKDRKVRIELGAGYGSGTDPRMQRIIDEKIVPRFRRGDHGPGLVEGARAVAQALGGDSGAKSRLSRAFRASSSSLIDRARHPGIWGPGAAALLGLLAYIVRRYARYHHRRCARCDVPLERLDEVSDDVYLDSGQRVEEFLKSVDYDVWKCPRCSLHTLAGYRRWLSSFKQCPKCSYRTLEVNSFTLEQPTTTSEGEMKVTRACRHCRYHDSEIVRTPMLQDDDWDTDSGGASYFGGGSSSGGGASGEW